VSGVNQQHFDLLVVGFMGLIRLYEQIIGSATERPVHLAPCTILVVK
jgi:nucleotide-binding universal stress UspA family protein